MAEPPDGLVAVGGTLEPARLVAAYRRGIFPWYTEGQPVLWWNPDPRMVFDRCAVHAPRRLKRTIRHAGWRFSLDRAFDEVVVACAAPRHADGGTWITAAMRHAYGTLHGLGVAHSIEVRDGDALIGGLYGVALGRVFFGESMFSRATGASKAALVVLAAHLRRNGFTLLDGQLPNAHLARLGAVEWPRERFVARIERDAAPPDPVGRWTLPDHDADGTSAVE